MGMYVIWMCKSTPCVPCDMLTACLCVRANFTSVKQNTSEYSAGLCSAHCGHPATRCAALHGQDIKDSKFGGFQLKYHYVTLGNF
jgi:hypothetical protein